MALMNVLTAKALHLEDSLLIDVGSVEDVILLAALTVEEFPMERLC